MYDKETSVIVKVKIKAKSINLEAKSLTATEQLHHQPQFILHHKGGIIRHNVGMVALAHSLDLFLQREENMGYKVTQEAEMA